ncbi:conserved hypothetical protein [Sphingobium sp. SYK-6]|uniref:DUF2971 domain-containing protein n=1 Tax=Sphingobium sp. (strain NBRC 103272 / SYK-6) TaxID=627192 RepID=UPI00022771AF|nr:DUF2971 domain-containing protein [Sphingobium sp. SYK-6]BAK66421.1 conserved hypothetical protein [Sphingobium sp. SYK-6]
MLLYHFVPSHWGLQNIQRRRVKVATLDALNDPFEMLAATSPSRAHRAAFRRAKAERAAAVGLLCFSRNWSNPVQWSHYADGHKGLCLGFEVDDARCRPVRYRKKRVAFDPHGLDDPAAAKVLIESLMTVKFAHWAYEEEVRVWEDLATCDHEGDNRFKRFSNVMSLKEVILGAECDTGRQAITAKLGDLAPTVRLRDARLAFKRFAVTEQLDSRRWQ